MSLFELKDISVTFGDRIVLKNFSAQTQSDTICLRGPSGCGKTTLLRVIAGLVKPDSGSVVGAGNRIAFMFQEDRLMPWLTAIENVMAVSHTKDVALAEALLDAVELSGEKDTYPRDLSGGMQRRVALARTLCYGGDMLILDEPFKGMDPPLVKRMAALLKSQDLRMIVSTHSDEEVELLGGTALNMRPYSEGN